MYIQVFAKPGVTILSGQPFIFTGQGVGQFWEVDSAPNGGLVHGLAQNQIDEFRNYDALLLGFPVQINLSSGVTKGDNLSPDGTGKYKKRTPADTLCGQALLNGASGSLTSAFFFPTIATSSQTATGSTAAPTRNVTTFAVMPEMSVQLITHGGDVRIDFNGSFNFVSLDNWDYALFVDDVEYTGSRRTVGFTSASILGIVLGTLDGIIQNLNLTITNLSAGSHKFEIQWKANAGSARALGIQRRLECKES